MNDLIAFLGARLAVDEMMAKAAADCDGDLAWFDSRVTVSGDHTIRTREGNRPACRIRRDDVIGQWGQTMDPDAAATHIARHDPARVLRDVEAKRAIVALHKTDINPADALYGTNARCEECGTYVVLMGPCKALRILAAVYSDHADYRAEWAA